MRLLTLNAHSLIGPDAEERLRRFIIGIADMQPDVIALQEVNQRRDAPEADAHLLEGCFPLKTGIPVRTDNFAARAAEGLRAKGLAYSWAWLPVKIGYGCFDEGLALLTRRRIARAEQGRISRTENYENWKTRRVLAVKTEGAADWFCSVHMGWWQDSEDPFQAQWTALQTFVGQTCQTLPVWLMGDFNAPAEIRGESYDCIEASGWADCWRLAGMGPGGATTPGEIDGWHGQATPPGGMRIDHIWRRPAGVIRNAAVVFDGQRYPAVSDHFGLLVDTQLRDEERQNGGSE